MELITEKHWRFLWKTLRLVGLVGCLVIFVLWLTLIAYYSMTRPHVPQSANDWTVRLYWSFSPPSYGTVHENARLISLHWWFFSFFVLIAASQAIRVYKLRGSRGP
jgi:hypothetical protein